MRTDKEIRQLRKNSVLHILFMLNIVYSNL